MAEEVRWYLAALGCKSLDEAVGAGATLLRPRSFGASNNNPEAPIKTDKITTTFLTDLPTVGRDGKEFVAPSVAELEAKAPSANVLACTAGYVRVEIINNQAYSTYIQSIFFSSTK